MTKTISFIFISILFIGLTNVSVIFGQYDTNNKVNWKEVCRTADAFISEPCNTLVERNNPYELTREGQRVLGCFLGGAAALLFPELATLAPLAGPALNCGGSSNGNNNDVVGNILSGILGK